MYKRQGDTISLKPVVANPFVISYGIVVNHNDGKISRSFESEANPLFRYPIKKGNNRIEIIGIILDHVGNNFRSDTIVLDFVGK